MKLDGLNEYYKNVTIDRNESITEKILLRLLTDKEKNVFIALGAAHLAGEGSVVQRLESKGFKATRLCK